MHSAKIPSRHETRPRLADEDGFTLTELLVVIVILGIVIAGLTQLMVSASHSQLDQTNRVGAQQHTRLALVKLRREIHCASGVSPNPNSAWPGPARSVTIVLGTYCPTYTSGIASVTWCTVGASPPYELYRYPHTSDLRTAAYGGAGGACTDTGSGRTRWASNIVDGAGVSGGNIFTGFVPGTMPAPNLTTGTSGSLPAGTYGYIVAPVTSAGPQPGTEATIKLTSPGSVTVNWSGSCPPYPGVTGYRVYGRTPGGENQFGMTTGCTYTDTGAAGTAGTPVSGSRTLTTLGVNIPVQVGDSKLFSLSDQIALRNTPR